MDTSGLFWLLIALVVGYYLFDLNRRQKEKVRLRRLQLKKIENEQNEAL